MISRSSLELHKIGAATLGRIVGLVMLLAIHVLPTEAVQKTIAADRPIAHGQIFVADGILTQQRPLANLPLAQDDPAYFAGQTARIQAWSNDRTTIIWAVPQVAPQSALHTILPPMRGPPVV